MKAFLGKNPNQIYFALLVLNAILLPTIEILEFKALSFASILLAAWYISTGGWKNRWSNIKRNKLLWLFCSLYFVNLFSLIQSENLGYATDILVRKLPLLLLPIIVATSPRLTPKHIHYILVAYVASLFAVSLFIYREGLAVLLNRNDLTDLVRLVPMHRPYLGMFCAFAIVALLYLTTVFKRKTVQVVTIILAVYFAFYIYVIYSKMVVIALGIVFLAVTFTFISKKLNTYVAVSGAILILIASGITLNSNERFSTVYQKISTFEDFSYDEYDVHLVSSINIRYINWGCSLHILQQGSNWITGLGLGNVQDKLQDCYKDRNPWIYEQKQNAHNEYLEEALRTGIVGLIILIFCFAVPLGLSIYYNNYFYLSFILLFALCSVTESLLSRQAGIMFYAFFNSLFAFNFLKSPNDRAASIN